MSSEMVERVAEAIRNVRDSDGWIYSQAEAAIRAMREPTQAMRIAGIAEYCRPDFTPEHSSTLVFNAIWRAMIDEALR